MSREFETLHRPYFSSYALERFVDVEQDSTIFEIYLEFILYRVFHRSNCVQHVL